MNVRQTLMLVTLRIIWRTSFGLKWRGRLSPKSQGGAICFGTMKVARVVEQQWAGIQLFRFTFILHQESVPETLVCGTPRLRQRSSKEVGQIIRKVTETPHEFLLEAARGLASNFEAVGGNLTCHLLPAKHCDKVNSLHDSMRIPSHGNLLASKFGNTPNPILVAFSKNCMGILHAFCARLKLRYGSAR